MQEKEKLKYAKVWNMILFISILYSALVAYLMFSKDWSFGNIYIVKLFPYLNNYALLEIKWIKNFIFLLPMLSVFILYAICKNNRISHIIESKLSKVFIVGSLEAIFLGILVASIYNKVPHAEKLGLISYCVICFLIGTMDYINHYNFYGYFPAVFTLFFATTLGMFITPFLYPMIIILGFLMFVIPVNLFQRNGRY